MLDLHHFLGIHVNQDVFILGSGPSLHSFNPELIKGRPIICVNGSIMKFHKQATYFFTSDGGVVDTHHWDYVRTGTFPIIAGLEGAAQHIHDRGNLQPSRQVCYFNKYPGMDMSFLNFLIFGLSSAHCAVHFANICMAKRIIVVGCDCQFGPNGEYYYWEMKGEEKDARKNKIVYELPKNDPYHPDKYQRRQYEFEAVKNYWKDLKQVNPDVYIEAYGGALEEIFPKYKGD